MCVSMIYCMPMSFELHSPFSPAGDQPQAITGLTDGLKKGHKEQTLLGVTGSGKTFSMANIIANSQRPTLIMSHNKTLAAQLASEFREFFPNNAVHYFVSFYDYYQPESYIPRTDTYIEKTTALNQEISRMRHAATEDLLSRRDVIIVASVSCIYGLGSPEVYKSFSRTLHVGDDYPRGELLESLVEMQYLRNDIDFIRGAFRVKGEVIEIFPANAEYAAIRLTFFGDELEKIESVHALTGEVFTSLGEVSIFPATHYVAPIENRDQVLQQIEKDMKQEVATMKKIGKELEAHRLHQRITFDLEMMRETGYVNGIENYSRYFDRRQQGEPPYTLLDFFPDDFLLFIDESHITVPQVGGMYKGDQARKRNLVDYGFRLEAALDNRPLQYDEFEKHINQVIYVSATPKDYEVERSDLVVEQLIRPTGLLDPPIHLKPSRGQIEHLMNEIKQRIEKGERTLVTTLTKRMAEELTEFLQEHSIAVQYLHSEVDTLERLEILRDLRLGVYDVLVGINLLREGLDLPEVSLVAILDADKEGFLRSATSLIQTIGRAARHENGKVFMYADKITDSMQQAIDETNRRREIQEAHNAKHNITPTSVKREMREDRISGKKGAITDGEAAQIDAKKLSKQELAWVIDDLQQQMELASKALQFEEAASLRDEIKRIQAEAK